jgi:hypothetical protein
MKLLHIFLFFSILFCCCFISCKKDSFITSSGARLRISADTLKYDTVFTTTGSVTQSFKIINNNDQKLLLSKVKLMGAAASFYKMNVNGIATTEATNLELAANDSMYVFVSVNINPNTTNLPFLVSDSILINYNGNNRFVQLQAYGQKAIFFRNKIIAANENWSSALPYVIIGGLRVNKTAVLTIPKGCKIYLHADAPFIVDGTLLVNGAKGNEAIFAGDRLDNVYKDLPASWPGIYFTNTSTDNILNFAIIKNGYRGVAAEGVAANSNPKLTLHQCVIDNIYDVGLLCSNTSLRADNCLISNCGNNVSLTYGGDYNLTHCTVVSYSTNFLTHKNPVLLVNNYLKQGTATTTADLKAVLRNCIFWADSSGLVANEVLVNKEGANSFNVLFDKNIYRGTTDPVNSTLNGNVLNQDPLFDSIDVVKRFFDFRITKSILAPGIDKGTVTSFSKDLDNRARNNGLPDLGCYEK